MAGIFKNRNIWFLAYGVSLVLGICVSEPSIAADQTDARNASSLMAMKIQNQKAYFATTDHLYRQCKESLQSSKGHAELFEQSFCSAFIQGFQGGTSIMALYTISSLDEEHRKSLQNSLKERNDFFCLPSQISNKDIATAFVDWIENSPHTDYNPLPERDFDGLAVALSHTYSCNSKK